MAQQGYGQFTTVLNIPPEPDIGDDQSIGSDTQLNLANGGSIGDDFQAGASDGTSTNVEVNISGGTIDRRFNANAGSVVNISGGVGDLFTANAGSEVNITGGEGLRLTAMSGSLVNVSGGNHPFLSANPGSVLNLSGGVVGQLNFTRSSVRIFGGDFRFNGLPISGLETPGQSITIRLNSDAISGILADGTPFAFSSQDSDSISFDSLTIQAQAIPASSPGAFTVPGDPTPAYLREDQSLVINEAGVLGDDFSASWGTSIELNAGGAIGDNLEVVGAQVDIHGGSIGIDFAAFVGSEVNIHGGSIDRWFNALAGSKVNISGGTIADYFHAETGSEVSITGGNFGFGFGSGGEVTIAGGTFGDDFRVVNQNLTTLLGGDFRINGELVQGLESTGDRVIVFVPSDSVLSGTLADGTPILLSAYENPSITTGISLQSAELPAIEPGVITLPSDAAPLGIREGQELVIEDGGSLAANFTAGRGSRVELRAGGQIATNFEAIDAEVTITGGSVGEDFDAYAGSLVNISGGTVGNRFNSYAGSQVNITDGVLGSFAAAFAESTVNISGGTVGDNFQAKEGSIVNISAGSVGPVLRAEGGSVVSISGGTVDLQLQAQSGSIVNISGGTVGRNLAAESDSVVNISGGSIGINFNARSGSEVNISGGSVGDSFNARDGSVVNVSGGTFGEEFGASSGSEVNLFGTEFVLDGVDITDTLTLNTLQEITDRNVTLNGLLADGTAFSFELSTLPIGSTDKFSSDALLTVTLVVDTVPGDYNSDGRVDLADYTVLRNNLGTDMMLPGDLTPGSVTAADYDVWKQHFGQGIENVASNLQIVPEPSGVGLLVVAMLLAVGGRRRAVSDQQ